jgi:Icc protein
MPSDILQLTDLHLLADRNAAVRGVRTRDSFVAVLEYARAWSRAQGLEFDSILVTGDLTHDEQLATYEDVRGLLGDWVPRCRVIPGNHDDRVLIRQVFPEAVAPGSEFVNFSLETAGWRLIGVDSHVDGEVYGRVDSPQLQWLAAELTTHAAQPTILFIHHPPVPVHSSWLDRIGLQDPGAFLDVVHSFSQVRVICTGHVHQEFSTVLGGVQILTTPSTGVQFLPHQEELICDSRPPGFRVFRLADGSWESRVVRLPDSSETPR